MVCFNFLVSHCLIQAAAAKLFEAMVFMTQKVTQQKVALENQ
jgi:hypothetical protein